MTTQNHFKHKYTVLFASMALLFSPVSTQVHAASTDIANVPMAVSNMVTPNVLVVYDNSQSMDAYMNGTLVSGNDPNTRGNIGRSVMRNAITTYRTAFNWGLMTYGMSGSPGRYNTYAYFLGDSTSMVFTTDCIDPATGLAPIAANPPKLARSASNGNRRCLANPQPFAGGTYVTYDRTGDDADIQDVLYTGGVYTGLWGLTSSGTSYNIYLTHNVASGNSWAAGAFGSSQGTWGFTPTDAGYLPSAPTITRQMYAPRGWGYNGSITGSGQLNEAVKADTVAHYNTLQTLLGAETNGATGEVKNGAIFTPLRGSLQTAKSYFAGTLSGNASPTLYSCQQNFVMLVTDGLPTGDTSGSLYSASDRANTCNWSTVTNSCTSGSFGTAATHAISATNALRTTSVTGYTSTNKDGTGAVTGKYDVQTYVVALGDTVANANALSVMNAMAYNGGTDKAILATNATAFQNAITAISDDITAKVGSSSAVAVANQNVTPTDNASYTSSFNSGTWTGDVIANAINVTTGVPSATPLWTAGSAATQLDLRTSASRYIATSTDIDGAIGGVQFQPVTAGTATKLSAAQQTLLNTPSLVDGAAVLAYLRGDRSGEPGTYRGRSHLLGDTINSEPVAVREPSANYTDTGYSAFKSSNASRARMLYQGANDGMLHAFDALTGAESWAYVPNLLMANLNNLSLKTGFNHKYYVDGTPVSADVDFNNIDGVTGGGDWRTILVGGLGKGGRGFYALDVSTPGATSEADVVNKVLWEFPNSISNATSRAAATLNMSYSFEKPVIVKTKAKGWVVLLTSGYNNGTNAGDSGGDGEGHVFVVNPKTGDLIKDIATTGCTVTPATNPCGLAHVSASIDSAGFVDYLYGGDLKGNLWRFDLTGASSTAWTVSKFANLADASNVPQPITTAPVVINGSSGRMILVGTGLYLGISDVATTQTQSMYGLKDSLVALPTPLRTSLQSQTISVSGTSLASTSNTVNYVTQKGWYADFPKTGERVNVQPTVTAAGRVLVNTNIPNNVACSPGGKSDHYSFEVQTGVSTGIYFGDVLASSAVPFLADGQNYSITHASGDPSAGGTVPPPPGCKFGPNNTIICLEFTPVRAAPKRTWRQLYLYQ